ncbi:hypothetical protein N7520_004287 [Penicillium odoratum]|uniref:uncharacterized protein n=1 Tax=Penicillium odoratum TaxID=1167516 RepID=UPI002547BB83|nr:uncharacterized protein N7520_004287 [Penicillium odoratum]KAJ5764728.1 hypothetical protein N7520_004287 [Penicillium odoratum]
MSHEAKPEVEHAAQIEVSADVAGWAGLAEDARNATAEEHSMKITKAIKTYPKASWGVFTTLAPAYALEVAPLVLRAHLETFVALCWGIGQFLSYALIYTQTHRADEWSWRIPLAVQWAWPAIIFPLILFAPEFPWWLVRHGRLIEAENAVKGLSSRSNNYETQAKQTVVLMMETTNIEKAITEGVSFADCFRESDLWRTEISCLTWASQVLCGFAISNYAAYFYQQAGLSTSNSYKMTFGQGGIHFACNLLSLLVTKRFGRRAIALTGYTYMSLSMLLLGFLALAHQNTGLRYGQAVIFLVWSLSVTAPINSQSGPLDSSFSTVAPYALNPTEGNLKIKTGFLAAGFSLLCLIWGYFRLPESKSRTYQELDILFSKNLTAREFKNASVDDADVDQMAKVNI